MEIIKPANLALRFLLELCILVALGYWGFKTRAGWAVKIGLGIGGPLVVAVVWEIFLAPNSSIRLQEPSLILRQDSQDETEFGTVNLFESLDAVKAFAGPDYDVPVFEPEARCLLSKVEPVACH